MMAALYKATKSFVNATSLVTKILIGILVLVMIGVGYALVLVIVGVSGKPTAKPPAETQSADEAPDPNLLRAVVGAASLRSAMRNPASFQLSSVLIMPDKTVCYQYRAQNGFGGMNIEYAVLTPNAANLSTDAGLWNRKCARKKGEDITALAIQRMDMVSRFVGK